MTHISRQHRFDPPDVLSISFLDVLSCGLGASILLFLVFSALPHAGAEIGRGLVPDRSALYLEVTHPFDVELQWSGLDLDTALKTESNLGTLRTTSFLLRGGVKDSVSLSVPESTGGLFRVKVVSQELEINKNLLASTGSGNLFALQQSDGGLSFEKGDVVESIPTEDSIFYINDIGMLVQKILTGQEQEFPLFEAGANLCHLAGWEGWLFWVTNDEPQRGTLYSVSQNRAVDVELDFPKGSKWYGDGYRYVVYAEGHASVHSFSPAEPKVLRPEPECKFSISLPPLAALPIGDGLVFGSENQLFLMRSASDRSNSFISLGKDQGEIVGIRTGGDRVYLVTSKKVFVLSPNWIGNGSKSDSLRNVESEYTREIEASEVHFTVGAREPIIGNPDQGKLLASSIRRLDTAGIKLSTASGFTTSGIAHTRDMDMTIKPPDRGVSGLLLASLNSDSQNTRSQISLVGLGQVLAIPNASFDHDAVKLHDDGRTFKKDLRGNLRYCLLQNDEIEAAASDVKLFTLKLSPNEERLSKEFLVHGFHGGGTIFSLVTEVAENELFPPNPVLNGFRLMFRGGDPERAASDQKGKGLEIVKDDSSVESSGVEYKSRLHFARISYSPSTKSAAAKLFYLGENVEGVTHPPVPVFHSDTSHSDVFTTILAGSVARPFLAICSDENGASLYSLSVGERVSAKPIATINGPIEDTSSWAFEIKDDFLVVKPPPGKGRILII